MFHSYIKIEKLKIFQMKINPFNVSILFLLYLIFLIFIIILLAFLFFIKNNSNKKEPSLEKKQLVLKNNTLMNEFFNESEKDIECEELLENLLKKLFMKLLILNLEI